MIIVNFGPPFTDSQRGTDFTHVILLASRDKKMRINPRFTRIAQEMSTAPGNRVTWVHYHSPADLMDPTSTEKICREIIRLDRNSGQLTINFTGGLKPMSIGAYLAGKAVKVPVLYVETQAEQIIHFANDHVIYEPFNLEPISVRTIIKIFSRTQKDVSL